MTELLSAGRIFRSGGAPRPLARLLLASLGIALPIGVTAQSPGRLPDTADRDQLIRIALAEDGRGRHPGRGSLSELSTALTSTSPAVRVAAVRGLGRQQDTAHSGRIADLFADRDSVVRREAINAFAQSFQSLRAGQPAARRTTVARAIESLTATGTGSPDIAVKGIVLRSIGRLPHADSQQARAAEIAILSLLAGSEGERPALAHGALHGLYSLARIRRTHGPLTPAGVEAVSSLFRTQPASRAADSMEYAAQVRRLALLTLSANGTPQGTVVRDALGDPDEQVRRLAVASHPGLTDANVRARLLDTAARDASWLVRLERVRAWRTLPAGSGCTPIMSSLNDANAHVVLAAIDGMAVACAGRDDAANRLRSLVPDGRPSTATGRRASWHRQARVLPALARLSPATAGEVVQRSATSPVWTVRAYAARAAAILADTALLRRLAADTNGNVREASLVGLRQVAGTGARDVLVSALGSSDYHVVLAGAEGLRGIPADPALTGALLQALERITREGRETSRDPREAILTRLEEFGRPDNLGAVERYLTDPDSAIALRAAALATRWSGRTIEARPQLANPPAEPVSEILGANVELVIQMAETSGGGSFVIRLDTRVAPVTSARLVRLARSGYYNGLTFHRVEPAFVIQGGSPAATEYVGDGPFMRDELGLASHVRGTIGISTRGRDTGDAQIFVNLVDNFRLDHDYTVTGTIVRGRDVAEAVLEADVIARVDVRIVR
jgi:cyclophilin family peptidyl-prolyl cis-trans isomerase